MRLTRDGSLGWLYRMPLWPRFMLGFLAGCALYIVVRWAFFGRPTSETIPGMIAGAVMFALIVGFVPITYNKGAP